MPVLRTLALLLLAPALLAAQEDEPVAPQAPLAQFAAQRVAVMPLQYWRPDTAGWSAAIGNAEGLAAADSAITAGLRDAGLGNRWAYAADVRRIARRNTLYASDPSAIGVARWRNAPPTAGSALPSLVADNLRMLTALGDTRYALIPVEVRGVGELAMLRLVLVDSRSRNVLWVGEIGLPGAPELWEAMAQALATLVTEP